MPPVPKLGSTPTEGQYLSKVELEKSTRAFSIYPNPSLGRINIDWETTLGESARIEIYDSQGQLILSNDNITATNVAYDFSKYPAGVYMVKLTTKKQTYTRKVTLLH